MRLRKLTARYRSLRDLHGERLISAAVRRFLVSRSRQAPRTSTTAESTARRRLFVDVSVIARDDAGTGIQRVVRGIMRHLPANGHSDWDVIFVAADAAQPYSPIKLGAGLEAIGPPIEAAPGDVFLGLDYSLHAIAFQHQQLKKFRAEGGRLWFLVHDLLPVQRPEWFSDQTKYRYAKWLRLIAMLADGYFCNSPQTEAQLRDTLRTRFGLASGFATVVLPMASDIASARLDGSDAGTAAAIPQYLKQRPYLLMVGTLEPRKGHDLIIRACEQLWDTGEDFSLVLVGRRGWKTEELEQRIAEHGQLGSRLFRFADVNDRQLEEYYRHCHGVIVAALAEGYGLPLIEALGYHKPVLARDLPIFRQHQDRGVRFFPDTTDAAAVAATIGKWLAEVDKGEIAVRAPPTSWHDTAEELMAALDQH